MIRTEAEYQEAVRRIEEEKRRLADQESALQEAKLKPDEIKRVLDPMRSFHAQLEEEVRSYERISRGEFDEIVNFQGMGQMLVCLRIALGLTQRELADKLGVNESQVSRDERNEYHNIQLERLSKILDALGVQMRTHIEVPPDRRSNAA